MKKGDHYWKTLLSIRKNSHKKCGGRVWVHLCLVYGEVKDEFVTFSESDNLV